MKRISQLLTLIMVTHSVSAQNHYPSTGNVGIGTNNPQANLHLYGTNPGIFIEGDNNSYYPYIRIKGVAGDGVIDNHGISNILNGINMRQITAMGSTTIAATNSGVVSHSQNPALVIHNVVGTTNQTGDVFRASKYTPDSYGNFFSTPMFSVTAGGNVGVGVIHPLEKMHVADGRIFLQAPDPGQWTSTEGAILRMGVHSYSGWYAGLGLTRGEGPDVYDMDFYTANATPSMKMKLTSGGNLGIGTAAPASKLHVAGGINAWAEADNLVIKNSSGNELTGKLGRHTNGSLSISAELSDLLLTAGANAGNITLQTTNANKHIFLNPTGGVGIGTTNPGTFKLAVEGYIGARKLIVKQTSWADYVFDEDYRLPTLREVEEYIKKHKHLPGIPSAKQIEKEGLDVGDNQAALLKKIEELTLYVIDMKKEIDQLKSQIKN